jgi:hypothetical protein
MNFKHFSRQHRLQKKKDHELEEYDGENHLRKAQGGNEMRYQQSTQQKTARTMGFAAWTPFMCFSTYRAMALQVDIQIRFR